MYSGAVFDPRLAAQHQLRSARMHAPGADQKQAFGTPAHSIAQPDRASKTRPRWDTTAPGKKPAAEQQPETEVDGFVSWPCDRQRRRVSLRRRNPRAKEHDPVSPSSRAIDLPSNVAVGPSGRRSSVTPPGFASPTLPPVRGPGSTTRDLTRDSWTRAPPCDCMLPAMTCSPTQRKGRA